MLRLHLIIYLNAFKYFQTTKLIFSFCCYKTVRYIIQPSFAVFSHIERNGCFSGSARTKMVVNKTLKETLVNTCIYFVNSWSLPCILFHIYMQCYKFNFSSLIFLSIWSYKEWLYYWKNTLTMCSSKDQRWWRNHIQRKSVKIWYDKLYLDRERCALTSLEWSPRNKQNANW